MARIYLTKAEQKDLLAKGVITIEREPELARTHKKSILHGVGTHHAFNKIEYHWVYGDVEDYFEKMKNVGRRINDYPNNTVNTWSGCHWMDCIRDLNEYGAVGTEFTNGRKTVIKFKLNNIEISELRQDPEFELYNRVTFKIEVILSK